jgi:ankyrin repeat protein/tRNA A-37 threonylcarbamoyl transferase component Bud32
MSGSEPPPSINEAHVSASTKKTLALPGIPEEGDGRESWNELDCFDSLDATSSPWPFNSPIFEEILNLASIPTQTSFRSSVCSASTGSYHSARMSSVYSGTYYSANPSSAESADFISAHSGLSSSNATLPSGGVAESTRDSEYRKLLEERGLLLPKEKELNWSGRDTGMGQHVEFEPNDLVPLEILYPLGFSLTAKVEKVRCRRILLARKSMKCNRRLKLSEAINEVEHLQKLRHAHIIQLIGSYVQGKTFAILLYPVADCNLSTFMEDITQALTARSMNVRDYLAILSLERFFRCLLHALRFIHDNTIKHMDIKPANILVKEHQRYDYGYQVYIADFGISRSFSQFDHSQTDSDTAKSPIYCAPEVHQGAKRGRSADIFSTGCVFLDMYTVLCRRGVDEFSDYRRQDGEDASFHSNLPRVSEWAAMCRELRPYLDPMGQGKGDKPTLAQKGDHIIIAILSMVDSNPEERPKARELAGQFGQNECCPIGPECLTDEEASGGSGGCGDPHSDGNTRPLTTSVCQRYLTGPTRLFAIQLAASNGHETVVKLLLEGCGVDRRLEAECSEVALLRAAERGHEAVVRLLVESGTNSSITDWLGNTALRWAAWGGREKVVQFLIEKGADTNVKDKDGVTPLYWAASGGHKGIAELLIENGADISAGDGVTPLHSAAWSGHDPVVELLIDKGADVNAQDKDGVTPLHRAALNGHKEAAEPFIEKGADINAKDEEGETPLYWVALDGHDRVVELLTEKGADINAKDKDGETPLHCAASNGHDRVVELLIEKGPDINAKDKNGFTPLHPAALNGHDRVVELLIEKGPDINAKDKNGFTPLHPAAWNGHDRVVELLIDKGADSNVKSKGGVTPLHWAASRGHKGTAELLIEKGAGVNVKDKNGDTPLHWAAERSHEKVVELLVEKGADINP